MDEGKRRQWSIGVVFGTVSPEQDFWTGGRVVDCARLESVCTAMYRGFESLPVRRLSEDRNFRVSDLRGTPLGKDEGNRASHPSLSAF